MDYLLKNHTREVFPAGCMSSSPINPLHGGTQSEVLLSTVRTRTVDRGAARIYRRPSQAVYELPASGGHRALGKITSMHT